MCKVSHYLLQHLIFKMVFRGCFFFKWVQNLVTFVSCYCYSDEYLFCDVHFYVLLSCDSQSCLSVVIVDLSFLSSVVLWSEIGAFSLVQQCLDQPHHQARITKFGLGINLITKYRENSRVNSNTLGVKVIIILGMFHLVELCLFRFESLSLTQHRCSYIF